MNQHPTDYPAALDIDYPDVAAQLVHHAASPAAGHYHRDHPGARLRRRRAHRGGDVIGERPGGILFCATALMLVFRQKYPGWWFDWNVALTAFGIRVMAYLALLRDEYPSTDEEQAVHLDIVYPDAGLELNRWLPLVKWLLAIPHFIILGLLAVAAVVCVIVAWFAILATGSYPRPLFDFVVGVFRWWLRVAAYAILLTTDRYPPFRLGA